MHALPTWFTLLLYPETWIAAGVILVAGVAGVVVLVRRKR